MAKTTKTQKTLEQIISTLRETAASLIPPKTTRTRCSFNDIVLTNASDKQKSMRFAIENNKCPFEARSLKTERNKIMKLIQDRVKFLREQRIDMMAADVQSATRLLRNTNSNKIRIQLLDADNKWIPDKLEAQKGISSHFRSLLI